MEWCRRERWGEVGERDSRNSTVEGETKGARVGSTRESRYPNGGDSCRSNSEDPWISKEADR